MNEHSELSIGADLMNALDEDYTAPTHSQPQDISKQLFKNSIANSPSHSFASNSPGRKKSFRTRSVSNEQFEGKVNADGTQEDDQKDIRKKSLYKTEMCRSREETGVCPYGPKCQFAHSPSELRVLDRHPKYKTEMCKTFWERGSCPYGRRCCFIHTTKEAENSKKPSLAIRTKLDTPQNITFHSPRARTFSEGFDGILDRATPVEIKSAGPTQHHDFIPNSFGPASAAAYSVPQSAGVYGRSSDMAFSSSPFASSYGRGVDMPLPAGLNIYPGNEIPPKSAGPFSRAQEISMPPNLYGRSQDMSAFSGPYGRSQDIPKSAGPFGRGQDMPLSASPFTREIPINGFAQSASIPINSFNRNHEVANSFSYRSDIPTGSPLGKADPHRRMPSNDAILMTVATDNFRRLNGSPSISELGSSLKGLRINNAVEPGSPTSRLPSANPLSSRSRRGFPEVWNEEATNGSSGFSSPIGFPSSPQFPNISKSLPQNNQNFDSMLSPPSSPLQKSNPWGPPQ